MSDIIRIIKYRPSRRLCKILAERIAPMIREIFPHSDWDLVVPLPASAQSLTTRGFNQCDVIAQAISRAVTVVCSPRALRHLGSTHAQASLPHELRIGNVRRSFTAREQVVRHKRILLVDDVTTTGATSAAAGLALLKSGATSVDLFTLARSDGWTESRSAVHRRIR